MFYHIAGELILKDAVTAVIDCGGVGYKLTVSAHTSENLGRPGEQVKLLTHLQVREDGLELFGFLTEEELSFFRMLTGVSGVGPKAAMAILSLMTPDRLADAIRTEDTRSIAKAQGVGAKTAARVVLELKDKVGVLTGAPVSGVHPSLSPTPEAGGKLSEAVNALEVLGYNRSEILSVLRGIDTEHTPLEEIIRIALKRFAS